MLLTNPDREVQKCIKELQITHNCVIAIDLQPDTSGEFIILDNKTGNIQFVSFPAFRYKTELTTALRKAMRQLF